MTICGWSREIWCVYYVHAYLIGAQTARAAGAHPGAPRSAGRRAARRGRPLAFDKAIYARRNVVERCINRLKQWRGVATRYEKRAVNYRAMVVLASTILWLES
jgi:transposase